MEDLWTIVGRIFAEQVVRSLLAPLFGLLAPLFGLLAPLFGLLASLFGLLASLFGLIFDEQEQVVHILLASLFGLLASLLGLIVGVNGYLDNIWKRRLKWIAFSPKLVTRLEVKHEGTQFNNLTIGQFVLKNVGRNSIPSEPKPLQWCAPGPVLDCGCVDDGGGSTGISVAVNPEDKHIIDINWRRGDVEGVIKPGATARIDVLYGIDNNDHGVPGELHSERDGIIIKSRHIRDSVSANKILRRAFRRLVILVFGALFVIAGLLWLGDERLGPSAILLSKLMISASVAWFVNLCLVGCRLIPRRSPNGVAFKTRWQQDSGV